MKRNKIHTFIRKFGDYEAELRVNVDHLCSGNKKTMPLSWNLPALPPNFKQEFDHWLQDVSKQLANETGAAVHLRVSTTGPQ